MQPKHIYAGVIILVIVGIVFVKMNSNGRADDPASFTALDTFAKCLADNGAIFYGAYWCPHCQAQKKMFDNSKQLPYVECSTANGQGQNQRCNDANIEGYPTWEFADGSRLSGERSLEELGEKTGCEVPTS